MSDITRWEITITSNGIGCVVPLEPPLKSLVDARQRLIDIDTYCIQMLDVPDIVVKGYRLPVGCPFTMRLGDSGAAIDRTA